MTTPQSGSQSVSRRAVLAAGVAGAAVASFAAPTTAAEPATKFSAKRPIRIGVISAAIEGAPQRLNGHTWQFCQPFHADVDLDAAAKINTPVMAKYYEKYFRNPLFNFGDLPFPDTTLTHIYAAHDEVMDAYTKVFRGVQKAPSVAKMAEEVDAIWLGDASGLGEDHFDLLAPAIEKGLPIFCDKPIGASVAGTKKIVDYCKKYDAPLMSSSIFCHQWGTQQAQQMIAANEHGGLQYAVCSQASACTSDRPWRIYGHHPVWMLLTVCGPGVEAVSGFHRDTAWHTQLVWPDRMPAHAWFGRPDISGSYCQTTLHFQKPRSPTYTWTPAIEGNFDVGHTYEIFRMADVFRQMIKTRVEPVPTSTIVEVTAIIHAAVKSTTEKSRLVSLAEMMG